MTTLNLIAYANPLLSNHSQTPYFLLKTTSYHRRRRRLTPVLATGGFSLNSILKRCDTCSGKGAIECPGCKGTGKNKKNGNIFERWKCFDCQGFGLKSCPKCGKGGLTPEQRGER
ncbi:hypothetical protein F8388_001313 [Cannabis sativa]|uniref:Uncharacterized protein n=1 Tax=Cannabis sativa TaxID=3483 RepID=A0A7J6DVJ7_CANSA|nr:hypothetical protein F8388_001313 [Cannabis sativa]